MEKQDLVSLLNSARSDKIGAVVHRVVTSRSYDLESVAIEVASQKISRVQGVSYKINFGQEYDDSAVILFRSGIYLVGVSSHKMLESSNNIGRTKFIRDKKAKVVSMREQYRLGCDGVIEFNPFSVNGKKDRAALEKDYRLMSFVDLGYDPKRVDQMLYNKKQENGRKDIR